MVGKINFDKGAASFDVLVQAHVKADAYPTFLPYRYKLLRDFSRYHWFKEDGSITTRSHHPFIVFLQKIFSCLVRLFIRPARLDTFEKAIFDASKSKILDVKKMSIEDVENYFAHTVSKLAPADIQSSFKHYKTMVVFFAFKFYQLSQRKWTPELEKELLVWSDLEPKYELIITKFTELTAKENPLDS